MNTTVTDTGTLTDIVADVLTEVGNPKRAAVVFYNDDVTPFEFVVLILVDLFGRTLDEAWNFAFTVHNEGKATEGEYPRHTAESLAEQAVARARANGWPLVVRAEEV